VALFSGSVEFLLPRVGVGVLVRGSYSPIKYQLTVNDMPNATPRGSLLDLNFDLRLHYPLSGTGRATYELVPLAGLRIASTSVDTNPGSIILSARAFAPVVGVGLVMPLAELLELTLNVDGGLVVSYSEDPFSGGESNGGLCVGGGADLRLWLSEMIAVAVDTRFDLLSAKRKGPSTRQHPPDEVLDNVRISTKDLRAALGIAFRL
jgi:hypothetical protein